MKGEAAQPINGLIMAEMKELDLIDPSVNIIGLELFGMRRGASIHVEGWMKMNEELLEAFWNGLSALDVEGAAVRDLNHIPLGATRFADYVIKVSDHTQK